MLALDNDPASVDAATENARINNVGIEVRRHDLRTDPTPQSRTIAANLLAPLLLAWAPSLSGGSESLPSQVIASGLLEHEADRVSAEFAAAGLAESERRVAGEWAALLLQRR